MEIKFFRQRHTLLRSFDIFVITYRVTNFLPKLVAMLLFSVEKTELPFLVFPYFRVMPVFAVNLGDTAKSFKKREAVLGQLPCEVHPPPSCLLCPTSEQLKIHFMFSKVSSLSNFSSVICLFLCICPIDLKP